VAVEELGETVTGTGELTIAQTSFGVRPWAAFLSGVEVADEVRVRFRVAFRRVGRSGD
jgi:hypothetical protein